MGFWDTVGGGISDGWDWLNKKPKQTDDANAQLGQGDYMTGVIQQGLGGVGGRQAPQAGGTTVGNVAQLSPEQQQWRQQQMALAQQYAGVASGEQKGAGALAVDDAARRALASQQSIQAMGRGQNAGLAARAAARGATDIGQQAAGQAAQAQIQDQTAARDALAGLTGQARGQDIQAGMANMSAQNQQIFQQAGLDQATSLANMQARLQQAGMNDDMTIAYLSQLYNISNAEMMARLKQEAINAQGQSNMQTIGQAAGAIGGALTGSGLIGGGTPKKPTA